VPTGTVQFAVDGTNFGTPVTLSDGMATSQATSTLAGGNHVITASYSGDSSYAPGSGTLAGGQAINSAGTAIADGTILVTNGLLSGQAAIGIIGVNPSTGGQTVISAGGPFSLPATVRQGPNQQLYVADYSASGTGAVIRFDPTTGQQTVVATGGNINGPNGLAIINGFLYVADTGSISNVAPNLVEINLSTGQQRLVSSGGSFNTPVSLAAAPNGNLYWADEYAFGGTGAIIVVNIQTGAQTVLTQGHLFNHMLDIGLDSSGNIISFNAGSTSGGSVVRVNPQTGVQTLISSGGILTGVDGGVVDVSHGGTIYVSALASGSNPSRILAIDPGTGAQRVVSSGGNLSLVGSMAVFSQSGAAGAASPPSTNAVFSGQAAISSPTIGQQTLVPISSSPIVTSSPGSTAATALAPTVALLAQPTSQPPPLSATGEDLVSSLAASTDQASVRTAAVDSLFAAWDGSLTDNQSGDGR
jgi:hypothetical protein